MQEASVLSVFDGMACGMLAMQSAGIKVDRYVAYEIDKYAVQTSSHNFPMIEHRGDVFEADFTEFEGFDFLIGGSPCTYWSIAQKNNRETVASGMGWELFSQYVRALHEAKPKFFVYENNKSMSKAIRASIDETFGFEAICINSALVSAQNRQRLYWVGKRNEDGTYSKVDIEQPEDRGILLKDVLDSGVVDKDKAYCLKHQAGNTRDYIKKHHTQVAFEPVCSGKELTERESVTLCGNGGVGAKTGLYAVPVGCGYRGRQEDGAWKKRYESNEEEKANDITTCQTDSMVAQPVNATKDGKSQTLKASPSSAVSSMFRKGTFGITGVAEPVGELTHACNYNISPGGTLRVAYTSESEGQGYRVYSPNHKSVVLRAQGGGRGAELVASPVFGYATPCEWDENGKPIKAMSGADGKTYTVYEVKDGQITIKGKTYPIKLKDGFYIIRKLTVRECMRLQTVPEWFEFPVSDTQAFRQLGNGWTVEIIAHLLRGCVASSNF